MSGSGVDVGSAERGTADLPGFDPRDADLTISALEGDESSAALAGRGRWWGFLVSDAGAAWTARIAAVVLWALTAALIDRIPGPVEVIEFLADHSDLLWPNIWHTLQSAIGALCIILVVGIALGFAMGRWWQIRYFFTDLVMVGIALPAFIWALLAVMWWGFGAVGPIFVAAVSATPMLIVSTRQGAQAVDGDLQKMSTAYRVPVMRQVRQLVLPTMSEYIIAGFRVAVLAAWGAILLVEFFGSEEGIGFQAAYWYDAGSFTGMMAWGFVMLVVIVAIDKVILEPVLRRTRRWRAESTAWTL
jgi:ABC-type nitrate/sulfonate/bicarbonate transport system permease component